MIRIEDLALSILTKTSDIVAYFSLLNDTIKFEEDDKKTRNRINRKIPYVKQRNHYPAVKIGRLAVSENYAHHSDNLITLS